MKNIFIGLLLLVNQILLAQTRADTLLPENDGYYLITCGQDQLYILDAQTSNGQELNIVWRWKLADAASQLPTAYMNYMKTLDDCKSVDDNTKLLMTSSTGGGVLLLERSTKKCLFYAHAPQAHSADLLPNGKIVVALSTTEQGNSIEVYDINKPEEVLFRDELHGAHGAVWMAARNRFYALGSSVLREYSLKNWGSNTPELILEKEWSVPLGNGHDLSAVNSNTFLVSSNSSASFAGKVYLFEIDTGKFTLFEPEILSGDIKSVNYIQETGWLVYTQAEENYWTENIYMINPTKKLTIPGYRMYKVRLMKKTE
ncbi:MAG: WD40 repeat domain-containing protein [Prevotellaceae bacterium]|nr:WD40 repeat domain-containing protein [Prevotellaceae bacterium]